MIFEKFSLDEASEAKIGTVTEVTTVGEFDFQVVEAEEKPRIQGFVVAEHPIEKGSPLLAKIVKITRSKVLRPRESAESGVSEASEGAAVPAPAEIATAACSVIGSRNERGQLSVPGFPVKPGSPVYRPSSAYLNSMLAGGTPEDDLSVGFLEYVPRVEVKVEGNEILNKHLAIIGMTGSGKTHAASVVAEELMALGYPVLVLDAHGDYVNIGRLKDGRSLSYEMLNGREDSYVVRVFTGGLNPRGLAAEEFLDFVQALSGEILTAPQRDLLKRAYEEVGAGDLDAIFDFLERSLVEGIKGIRGETIVAVQRQVDVSRGVLAGVEADLRIEEIADSLDAGRGAVLNMAMLPDPVQRVTAQITLDRLFRRRKNYAVDRRNPPFPPAFIIVEEAHSFAPSVDEAVFVPSRAVMRRVMAEAMKFGFSLCLVTQRPSMLDEVALSLCDSQIVLRLVNPEDRECLRRSVEAITEEDSWALPDLTRGEALLLGEMVQIPCVVRIRDRKTASGLPAVNRLREIVRYAEEERRFAA